MVREGGAGGLAGVYFAERRLPSPSPDGKGASAMAHGAECGEGLFRKLLFPLRDFYVNNRIAINNRDLIRRFCVNNRIAINNHDPIRGFYLKYFI
jgi:hypothetical protein